MKKLILVASLCICGLSYAATSDNFNVKARVVEPVAIELNERTLDFGHVIRGTIGVSKTPVVATITGEGNSNVRVKFTTINGQEIQDGQITLNNEKGDQLTALLYMNNNPDDLIRETAYTLENGETSFDIRGTLDVPTNANSGNYVSQDIVVSVLYDKFD